MTNVALYAAGRTGVGQTIRALRIADYLAANQTDSDRILVVSGVPRAETLFPTSDYAVVSPPEVVGLVDLVRRGAAANERAVGLQAAQDTLRRLMAEFRPNTFIAASHVGICGELESLLPQLGGSGCRRVLALRDIYHPPRYVKAYENLSRDSFDIVLVCGPASTSEWIPGGLLKGELSNRTHFVGYLRPVLGPWRRGSLPKGRRLQLNCQVGGGSDGRLLAELALAMPPHFAAKGIGAEVAVTTGPLMSEDDVSALQAMNTERTSVLRWQTSWRAQLARKGATAVSMAGYNSCVEAGWGRTPTVLVPRVDPSDSEQEIRAALFSTWFPNVVTLHHASIDGLAEGIELALERCRDGVEIDLQAGIFAHPTTVAGLVIGSI